MAYWVILETSQDSHVTYSWVSDDPEEAELYRNRYNYNVVSGFKTRAAALFYEQHGCPTVEVENPWGSGTMTIRRWDGLDKKPWSNNLNWWRLIESLALEACDKFASSGMALSPYHIEFGIMSNIQLKGVEFELQRLAAATEIDHFSWELQVMRDLLQVMEIFSLIFDDRGAAIAIGWFFRKYAYFRRTRVHHEWQLKTAYLANGHVSRVV